MVLRFAISFMFRKFRLLNDVACEKLESWNDIFVSNLNWFYVNFVSENEKKKQKTKWDFLFPFIVTCKTKLIAITAPKYIQHPAMLGMCMCKSDKNENYRGQNQFFSGIRWGVRKKRRFIELWNFHVSNLGSNHASKFHLCFVLSPWVSSH